VLDLIRLRRDGPAFEGDLLVTTRDPSTLTMTWRAGDDTCELEVDLGSGRASIATEHAGVSSHVTP
jgi:hypothetical protein